MNPRPLRSRPAEIYARRQLPAIAARWNEKAKAWDRELEDPDCHFNEDDAYQRYLREIREVIASRAAFCVAHGVIDAGCGTGLVLEQVIASFAWGIGVDISDEMIRLAQAKHLPGAQFLVGDCFNLSGLCPPAGAVLSRGVLLSHYGPRQGQKLLAQARASLVTGGFAVFDFLNAAARTRYRHHPRDKTYFTGQQVHAMAIRSGFLRATMLGADARRVLLLLTER